MRTALWIVYAIFWVGGVIQGGVSPQAPWTAPLFLLLAAVLAINENRASWKGLAAAGALGFIVELIGVHTGYPFGSYSYTPALGPAIGGVPIAIACAWLILIDFAGEITSSILAGAVLLAAIDLTIDPVAAGPLHYWVWSGGGLWHGVPWTNFAGWIAIAAIILAVAPVRRRGNALVGWSIVAFFTLLALRHRLWSPGAIGFALIPLTLYFRRAQFQAPAYRPSDISYRTTPESE